MNDTSNTFDATLDRHVNELGFRLELITPADEPTMAVMSRGDEWLRLGATEGGAATIEQVTAGAIEREMVLPDLAPALVVSQANGTDETAWVTGRAGMRYRDLIPGRLGGRFIASHIEVCDGGPVPDMVHHHAIRFQMIFCHRGWVDVVYEDQGEPFRMYAGDCVLQPPHMRHKVLASSGGAQVVEIGCPASHDTLFDYAMVLPNQSIDRERKWGGQRFVRHIASESRWKPARHDHFEVQHTSIAEATNGLASVRVLRPTLDALGAALSNPGHNGEFWFTFVLDGSATLAIGSTVAHLVAGDAVTIPADQAWELADTSAELQLLEVVL